jgi:hypothetical protein
MQASDPTGKLPLPPLESLQRAAVETATFAMG